MDRDRAAIEIARSGAPPNALHRQLDMRLIRELPGDFDVALCWWQSFGYFDEATNDDVLRQISRKLRVGGRLLLDIYQRRYWEQNQGQQVLERKGVAVRVVNSVRGNRLKAELHYGDSLGFDLFEWQLYDLPQIVALAESVGLALLVACTECAESKPVAASSQSMQLVFERATGAHGGGLPGEEEN